MFRVARRVSRRGVFERLQPRRWVASGASSASSPYSDSQKHDRQDESEPAATVKPLQAGEYARRGAPALHTVIDEMVRVDHAGEAVAVSIYEGQLAVVRDPKARQLIQHMKEQEDAHLEAFEHLMPKRRARPTLLLPLCRAAGFALGAGTALLGDRAAMACTVAVEEVIVDHYNDQLRTLNEAGFKDEAELRAVIKKNRDEEDEHRATGIENEAEQAPFYNLLSGGIKLGCQLAIAIAKRV